MKFIHFWLIVTSILSISTTPIKPVPGLAPEIHFGLMDASVGLNPQTGAPSGWYTSDVTIRIVSPMDVLANGKPVQAGQLTLSDEGQHQVEFQPGIGKQDNEVTQFVNIDKTPPGLTWITQQNSVISENSDLSAEITDQVSGICRVEASLDHGQNWERQDFPAPVSGESGTIRETAWSMHLGTRELSHGVQVALLRAYDCAGNVSPAELLVFRVK